MIQYAFNILLSSDIWSSYFLFDQISLLQIVIILFKFSWWQLMMLPGPRRRGNDTICHVVTTDQKLDIRQQMCGLSPFPVSRSSVHCPACVLLSIILHYNSTENPKIRQFSFYLQLWAKVNVSPGCRVRLIQSNGQKIIWGPRGRGLCKLLPCSPTSLFISNPKLENITKNITAYSNKWLHSGNNGSAGPDSANNGQRIKYASPVTLDGALFVDYCHDGSSSLVAGPGSSLHEQ